MVLPQLGWCATLGQHRRVPTGWQPRSSTLGNYGRLYPRERLSGYPGRQLEWLVEGKLVTRASGLRTNRRPAEQRLRRALGHHVEPGLDQHLADCARRELGSVGSGQSEFDLTNRN